VALYLEQPDLRKAAGRAAYTLVTDNRGALTRTLDHVVNTLRAAGSNNTKPLRSAAAAAVVPPP